MKHEEMINWANAHKPEWTANLARISHFLHANPSWIHTEYLEQADSVAEIAADIKVIVQNWWFVCQVTPFGVPIPSIFEVSKDMNAEIKEVFIQSRRIEYTSFIAIYAGHVQLHQKAVRFEKELHSEKEKKSNIYDFVLNQALKELGELINKFKGYNVIKITPSGVFLGEYAKYRQSVPLNVAFMLETYPGHFAKAVKDLFTVSVYKLTKNEIIIRP